MPLHGSSEPEISAASANETPTGQVSRAADTAAGPSAAVTSDPDLAQRLPNRDEPESGTGAEPRTSTVMAQPPATAEQSAKSSSGLPAAAAQGPEPAIQRVTATPAEPTPVERLAETSGISPEHAAAPREPAVQRVAASPPESTPRLEPTIASAVARTAAEVGSGEPSAALANEPRVVRRSTVAEPPSSTMPAASLPGTAESTPGTSTSASSAPTLSPVAAASPLLRSSPAVASPAPKIGAASAASLQRVTAAAMPPPPPPAPTVVHAAGVAVQREAEPSNASGVIQQLGPEESTGPEPLDVRKLAEQIWPMFYRKLRTERERERGLT